MKKLFSFIIGLILTLSPSLTFAQSTPVNNDALIAALQMLVKLLMQEIEIIIAQQKVTIVTQNNQLALQNQPSIPFAGTPQSIPFTPAVAVPTPSIVPVQSQTIPAPIPAPQVESVLVPTSTVVMPTKPVPTLEFDDSLPSTGVGDGRLLRFTIAAPKNSPISIQKLTFKIATSSLRGVYKVQLTVFSNAYEKPVLAKDVENLVATSSAQDSTLFEVMPPMGFFTIPADGAYHFELRAIVAGITATSFVTTALQGDSQETSNNFIWSAKDLIWSNGFGVPGMKIEGFSQTRH